MRVWWVLGLLGVATMKRSTRGAGTAGNVLGFSYNLGPGSYASFNLPQPQSSPHNIPILQHSPAGNISPNNLQPIPGTLPPSSPGSQISLFPSNHVHPVQPVPIFLNTPVPNLKAQVQIPLEQPHPHPPLAGHPSPLMSKPISLHNYKLPHAGQISQPSPFINFGPAHLLPGQTFQTNFLDHPHPENHPHSVYTQPSPSPFVPSRPDILPPHLHPAHHPVPDPPPQPFPIYSATPPSNPPPVNPSNQYDPFEFSKTDDEDKTPTPSIAPPPFQPNNAPSFPINQPAPPISFPIATLSPLPGPPPLFPQYDEPPPIPLYDDFPEYDAVPANIPFSRLIQQSTSQSKASKETHVQKPRLSNHLDQSPSEFLFTASPDIGFPTAQRLKRKNVKKSKMFNSHGGPVNILDISELCGKTVDEDDLNLLNDKFAACEDFLGPCGLNHTNNIAVTQYGICLNSNYPETVTLNLGRTLSSGHGSVSFHSDRDCTNFVHQFFPSCGKYLHTCSQVEQDSKSAALILGCLFGQYPSLMVPLLTVEQDLSNEKLL